MTVVNPYLSKSTSKSKPNHLNVQSATMGNNESTINRGTSSSRSSYNSTPQQIMKKTIHQSSTTTTIAKGGTTAAVTSTASIASRITSSSGDTHRAPKSKCTIVTPPKNKALPLPSSPPTKKKRNIKASFKAQLKKQIANLQKQKRKQIQHEKDIQHQQLIQKQKLERQIQKQKLQEEKDRRRLVKMQEKQRFKEEMKLKLKRDLAMKQKIEEERIEKKKREQEERERLKEERRKEREVQRRLELEKKREERKLILEQKNNIHRQQQQQQVMMMMQSQMILAKQMQMQTSSVPTTSLAATTTESQIQTQQPTKNDNDDVHFTQATAYSQQPYSTYHQVINPLVNSTSLFLNNNSTFHPYYQPYNNYNQMISASTSFHPMNNATTNSALPYFSSPFVSSIHPYYNNPALLPYITSPVNPSITSEFTTTTTATKTSTSIQKKQRSPPPPPSKQKSMILHENPLELPSPFVKTHVLLPYTIVITKKKGQTFGINIRYETRGTFVEVNNNDKEEEAAAAAAVEVEVELKGKKTNGLDHHYQNNYEDLYNDKKGSMIASLSPSLLPEKSNVAIMENKATPLAEEKECKDGIIICKCTNDEIKTQIFNEVVKFKNESKADETKDEESNPNAAEIKSEKTKTLIQGSFTSLSTSTETKINEVGSTVSEKNDTKPNNDAQKPTITNNDCLNTNNEKPLVLQPLVELPSEVPKESKIVHEDKTKVFQCAENNPQHVSFPVTAVDTQMLQTSSHPITQTTLPQGGTMNNNVSNTAITDVVLPSGTKQFQSAALVPVVKKPKKKKISFGVMSVIGAEKQKSRAIPGTTQDKLIQTNDIILKINGKSVTGMTFPEAAKLFSEEGNSNQNDDVPNNNEQDKYKDEEVECVLTVAREKKVMKIINKLASLEQSVKEPIRKKRIAKKDQSGEYHDVEKENNIESIITADVPVKIPLVIDESKNEITSGNFSSEEYQALIYGVKYCFGNIKAFVNDTYNEQTLPLFEIISKNPLFDSIVTKRYAEDFVRKWFHETRSIEKKFNATALNNLKENWRVENENSLDDKIEFMLESQRSMMRNLPRPSRGCKCQSLDHEYVNDPKCILYRNIRRMFPSESLKTDRSNNHLFDKYEGKLNSVGAAHLQRAKKRMEREEAEEEEAAFVAKMENLQLSKLQMAIFCPNVLTILVISAIASLQDKMNNQPSETKTITKQEKSEGGLLEQRNGLPGKRGSEQIHTDNVPAKRQKIDVARVVSSYCLAELLLYISKTWGHLYKEPDHEDYAWYEECRKGPSRKSSKTFERNPRRPGQFSFEVLKYVIDDSLIKKLKNQPQPQSPDHSTSTLHDELLILHIASDFKSGLMREINALVVEGIISIDENGSTRLNDGWEMKMHSFVLNDMLETGWSVELDCDNKFNLHKNVRAAIDLEWKHTPEGWLSQSKKKIMYYHHEHDYSRQIFDSKFEDYMNEVHGIAQFGI